MTAPRVYALPMPPAPVGVCWVPAGGVPMAAPVEYGGAVEVPGGVVHQWRVTVPGGAVGRVCATWWPPDGVPVVDVAAGGV